MVGEKEINSKCMRVANFLKVNQEQVVWWSQSYSAWLNNSHRGSPARPQLPEPAKTTEMDDFKEDNQDGENSDNSVEFSIDHP